LIIIAAKVLVIAELTLTYSDQIFPYSKQRLSEVDKKDEEIERLKVSYLSFPPLDYIFSLANTSESSFSGFPVCCPR
jgi:hypothetical protein